MSRFFQLLLDGVRVFEERTCWADTERRVAAALLTSGKPFRDPELDYLFELLRQIALASPRLPS